MGSPDGAEITRLLKAWGNGDESALQRLTPLVYDRLRRLAWHYVRRERPGVTLQGTALVHEVFLRLVGMPEIDWRDRAHFFTVASRAMRRILVDAARARQATKRGGQLERADLPDSDIAAIPAPVDRAQEVYALDHALTRLASLDPRRAQVIELRFFGGLTVDETAEVLGLSPLTVKRDWKTARTWLARELQRS
jgi:RNA polymerase sigma factor (TIGR02999 family)